MLNNKIYKWVICGLLLMGGVGLMPMYGYMSYHNRTWGDNGYVHDYYYGERAHFQQDDNMFNYGSTATWDMYSTSTDVYTAASFATCASNIVAGSTLDEYQYDYVAKRTGRTLGGTGWQPPTAAPIGDGWDVMLFLLMLAGGVGFARYKKSDRFAVRSQRSDE